MVSVTQSDGLVRNIEEGHLLRLIGAKPIAQVKRMKQEVKQISNCKTTITAPATKSRAQPTTEPRQKRRTRTSNTDLENGLKANIQTITKSEPTKQIKTTVANKYYQQSNKHQPKTKRNNKPKRQKKRSSMNNKPKHQTKPSKYS